jgi:protein-tyrosine sulfotransferase
MAAPPFFVLSTPRSGSTLLRYILDTHSRIASPGEIGIGQLCSQVAKVILGTKGEAMPFLSAAERTTMVMTQTRDLVSQIMSAYLALKGKCIWCDKTVTNVQHLATLSAVFPDARFICLYRDSLDFVQSSLECSRLGFMLELAPYAVREPTNLVAAMLSAWIENTTLILDLELQNPQQAFRIRYEDLVTTPEQSLRPLLAFAGVAWEDGLLDAVFTTPHDPGGGDSKIAFTTRIDAANVGKGQGLDLSSVPAATIHAAEALCARLSYPPLTARHQLAPAAGGEVAAASGGDDAGSVRGLIATRIAESLARCAGPAPPGRGSCRLVLHGQDGGSWRLEFAGGCPTLQAGGAAADCTLTASAADFKDILAGRLNPAVALWRGKVSVEGDYALAEQVGQLLYPAGPESAP